MLLREVLSDALFVQPGLDLRDHGLLHIHSDEIELFRLHVFQLCRAIWSIALYFRFWPSLTLKAELLRVTLG